MNYQTYEANPDLQAFVKCYWTLEHPKEEIPVRQTIVPDGCIELLFHFADLYRQYLDDGSSIVQPRSFVIGQLTRPLEIEACGSTGIFSVRFHPSGFLPFTNIAMKDLENTAIQLHAIFGVDGPVLEAGIVNATSHSQRIQVVEEFLLARLRNARNIDRIVKSTVETMLTANGQIRVDDLSSQMHLNRRQLERKFSTAIGLSPKQLSKVIRLQATLKLLLNKEINSLTALATEGEYYDQAHFIKDFKEFTGRTPKEFYRNNMKMSALFISAD